MYDNKQGVGCLIGQQIRQLRQGRGWTLAALARRVGTSAPTLHRYENGWDRFELDTLKKIATALDARLEVRFIPTSHADTTAPRPSATAFRRKISPLFWDHDLLESDLRDHSEWVLERVLTSGNLDQVRAARAFFGDDALRRAAERQGVDRRTRQYWRLLLGGSQRASQGARS